uniref:Uncharacterized protein n=1 Tax=Anguilla anguilla TaxID=7936 RepID=A0A0E9UJM1_ANGAN
MALCKISIANLNTRPGASGRDIGGYLLVHQAVSRLAT